VSLKQQCLWFESGVADFLFGCLSSFWYRGGYLVYAVYALLVGLGRVASWLVAAGSERQVIAVVCGSGIGDVLIELWLLFVWLDFLCE
jgi:hypothetical protein